MLQMGCATVDVTPPFPTYLRGYASRNKLSDTVEEPVEAGIIALEKDGKKTLIITVDSLGIEYESCKKITAVIAEKFGINVPDVIISCSHTHFAPGFIAYCVYAPNGELALGEHAADQQYFDFWMGKVIPGIEHALADLEAVELQQAEIPVSSVAFNRRTIRKADGGVTTNYLYPEDPENYDFSPIDTTMHVWKFMRGKHPKAVLARYGCHPVTGGSDHYAISADYPGFFKQAIRTQLGCPGFFILGTAGDVVPMRRNGTSRQDIGEVLARSVKLYDWTFRKTGDFDLKTACVMMEVKSNMLEGKTMQEIDNAFNKSLQTARATGKSPEDFYMDHMRMEFFHVTGGKVTYDLPIQLMQLGDKVLVCLPFEVLTNVGAKIRESHPEAVIVSCSCGYQCYLPLAEDFPKGGYETDGGTVLAHDTGDRIAAAAIAALDHFNK